MADSKDVESKVMGRARASLGLAVGTIALLAGLGLRGLLFVGAPDVPRDDAVLFSALILVGVAVFFAWYARPERDVFVDLGLWPIAALLGVAMPVLALWQPAERVVYLPAGLEVAGAVTFLVSFVRLQKARAAKRLQPRTLDADHRVRLLREEASKHADVPAASLVKGDRFAAEMEEELVVDGVILNGTGFVDETQLCGPGLPTAKKVGEYVFAGTVPSIPDLQIAVGATQDDSLILQRDRFAASVGAELLETSGAHRAAALWVLLLGAGAVAIVLWRSDLQTVSTWLPGVAAACVAAAAAAPALAGTLGRVSLLLEAKRAGVFVTRAKDVLALAHVRRWQIDPLLLAAPGAVEAAPFADVASDTILALSAALLSEDPIPERTSVRAAMEKKKLESLAGAALEKVDGVYRGTVNGRRWYLGPEAAIEKVDGLALDESTQGTLDFLRGQKPVVFLLGEPAQGIVGAIGIDVRADADAKAAAQALEATLMPGLPDATREAVAKAAGVTRDGPPTKGRDGTLLAETTEPPSKGLRLRVVSPRPGMKLEPSAPRIAVTAIGQVPKLVDRLERIASASSRRAWVATLLPPLVVAGLAFGGVLFPWCAAVAGIVTTVYAGRVPSAKDEAPKSAAGAEPTAV
ncbi:MAG: hypothetical protein RMA76_40160 [Deltaproteobacteria bacterium]